MWGISIYADFRPAVVVGLGNDLLFNSSVGHCAHCKLTEKLVKISHHRNRKYLLHLKNRHRCKVKAGHH